MLVWFGATLGALLLLFGALTYARIEAGFVPLTQELAREILKSNAAELGRQLDNYRIVVQNLARDPVFQAGDVGAIRGTLARLEAINPDFEVLSFADARGDYITSSGETGHLPDLTYWKAIMEEGRDTVISAPLASRSTGEPIFLVVTGVTDRSGRRIGTVAAMVSMTTMSDKAERINFTQSGGGWIADRNGRVIAHPDPEFRMKLDTARAVEAGFRGLEGVAEKLRRGESGQVSYQGRDGDTMLTLFSPIPGSPGWTYGIAFRQHELFDRPKQLTRQIVWLMAAMVVAVLLVVVVLSRKIAAPILELQRGVEAVSGGNLDQKIEVRTGDEIQSLAEAFNRMTGNLRTYIANLEEATVERERAATELELARRIQESSLPDLIQVPGAELASVVLPAREVAGDFYEYFPLPNGRIALIVGDVSGKGVSAALFAARAAQLLRSAASILPPQDAIAHVNGALARHNPDVIFLTLFFAIWSPGERTLHYVNAGHNPPLLLRVEGTIERLAQRGGPALGPMRGRRYAVSETTLRPGDLLAVYSDGITEAPNADGVMFGEERLGAMLRERKGQPLAAITDGVTADVIAWQAGSQPFDDVTLLLARGEWPVRSLQLAADPANVEVAVETVRACAAERGMESNRAEGFALAVCEAATNIVTHALGSNPSRKFRVYAGWTADALVVRFEDEGPLFGLDGLPGVDVQAPLADRPIGGLGWLLIQHNCDDVRIERAGATNLLTLVRRWPVEAGG